MSKYFKAEEFIKCSPPCNIEDMDEGFLSLLDKVRERANTPMQMTCAYRDKAYDIAKGRSGNSAHTRGLAVDIAADTSSQRLKIVRAAILEGITRIGIGKTFVHLDNDTSLPQGVMWDYYD